MCFHHLSPIGLFLYWYVFEPGCLVIYIRVAAIVHQVNNGSVISINFYRKKMRFWHYLKALRTKSSYLKEAQIWGKNELVHFKAHSKMLSRPTLSTDYIIWSLGPIESFQSQTWARSMWRFLRKTTQKFIGSKPLNAEEKNRYNLSGKVIFTASIKLEPNVCCVTLSLKTPRKVGRQLFISHCKIL